VLAGGGPLTRDELVVATELPPAIVDASLARLEREGVVTKSEAGWALALPPAPG
jgi:DNA-binding IclR family transcriptional regulator